MSECGRVTSRGVEAEAMPQLLVFRSLSARTPHSSLKTRWLSGRVRLRLGLFMGASLIALAGLVVLFGGTPRLFSTDAKYADPVPRSARHRAGHADPQVRGPHRTGDRAGTRPGQRAGAGARSRSIGSTCRASPKKPTSPAGCSAATPRSTSCRNSTPDGQPVPRGDEWPPGSEIPGVPPITPRSLLNPASAALTNAQQSARQDHARRSSGSSRPRRSSKRAADEAAELFKDVRVFIPELRKTNQKLQNLLGARPAAAEPGRGRAGRVRRERGAAARRAAEPNLRALIRDAQDAVRTIRPAIEDFRATMRRLEPDLAGGGEEARQAFDSVNEVLSPENRKEVAELLKNLNAVVGEHHQVRVSLERGPRHGRQDAEEHRRQVTQVGLVVGDVRAVTRPLAARSEGLVKSVADSADELSKLIAEVRGVVGAFAKENGTVQKLITDPARVPQPGRRGRVAGANPGAVGEDRARPGGVRGQGGAAAGVDRHRRGVAPERRAEGVAGRAELPPGLAAGVARGRSRAELAPAARRPRRPRCRGTSRSEAERHASRAAPRISADQAESE